MKQAPHASSGQGSIRIYDTSRSKIGSAAFPMPWGSFPTYNYVDRHLQGRKSASASDGNTLRAHTTLSLEGTPRGLPPRGGNAGVAARQEDLGAWSCGNGLKEAL